MTPKIITLKVSPKIREERWLFRVPGTGQYMFVLLIGDNFCFMYFVGGCSFKCDVTTCDIYLILDKHHHVWKGNVLFFSFFLFPIILAKQIREWFEVHIDTKKWPYFLFQAIILGIHVSFQGCKGPLTTFCLTFKSSYSTTVLLPKTLGSLRR